MLCRHGAQPVTTTQTHPVVVFACVLAGMFTPFMSMTLNTLHWNPFILLLFLYFYYFLACEMLSHSQFSFFFILILFNIGVLFSTCCVCMFIRIYRISIFDLL